jgi:hypothetical protein
MRRMMKRSVHYYCDCTERFVFVQSFFFLLRCTLLLRLVLGPDLKSCLDTSNVN